MKRILVAYATMAAQRRRRPGRWRGDREEWRGVMSCPERVKNLETYDGVVVGGP